MKHLILGITQSNLLTSEAVIEILDLQKMLIKTHQLEVHISINYNTYFKTEDKFEDGCKIDATVTDKYSILELIIKHLHEVTHAKGRKDALLDFVLTGKGSPQNKVLAKSLREWYKGASL